MRAPITEALVDVQVTLDPSVSLDALRSFNEPFAERYPQVKTQTQWASQVTLQGPGAPTMTSQHGVRGYVFLDGEGKKIVQVRRDGFTFSRLAPYETWEALRSDAKDAWDRYVHVAAPTQVKRIALRYINHLRLPAGKLSLDGWFKTHPSTPDELGPIADMLLRVVFNHPDDPRHVALVTLGSAPNAADESGFLLDIDTWVLWDREIDDSIWGTLDDLHEYKNDVFFGSLTNATLERIKG